MCETVVVLTHDLRTDFMHELLQFGKDFKTFPQNL